MKLKLYSCADQQQLRHLSTVNDKILNQTNDDDDNEKKLLRFGEKEFQCLYTTLWSQGARFHPRLGREAFMNMT